MAPIGKTLVIGGDGMIGTALTAKLRDMGVTVDTTSRRHGALRIDLADLRGDWLVQGYEAVVICAALTDIAECERHPSLAARINVLNTKKLMDGYAKTGAHVVFLSTSAVFDGHAPFPSPDDETVPQNRYGALKLAAEDHLRAKHPHAAILRMTKVLGPNAPLLQTWRDAVAAGRKPRAFGNWPVSPVDLPNAVDAIASILKRGAGGTFQLGAEEEITYAELAGRVLKLPAEAIDAADGPPRPPHASLATVLPNSASVWSRNNTGLQGKS